MNDGKLEFEENEKEDELKVEFEENRHENELKGLAGFGQMTFNIFQM